MALSDGTMPATRVEPSPASKPELRGQNWMTAHRKELGALVLYALLLVLRAPRVLIPGRFWAEEGTVYFAYAWNHPWWNALVVPHLGYYNFAANFATVLAAHVPLEFAAGCTAAVALLIQIIPAALVLFASIPGVETLPRRLAALVLLLVAPAGMEVCLNSVTSHFILSAAAGLVLVAGHGGRAGRVGKCLVLVIAGLTGAVSIFLAPFFWLQWWLERRRERLEQAAILSVCALIQFGFIHWGPAQEKRDIQFSPGIIAGTAYAKFMLMPLAPARQAYARSQELQESLDDHKPLPGKIWLATAAGFALFLLLCWRARSRTAWLLAAAAGWVSLLSFMGSHEPGTVEHLAGHVGGAFRYYYAPQFFFFLALLVSLGPGSRLPRALRLVDAVWLGLALLMGSLNFAFAPADWPYFFSGPSWKVQVEQWRKDPAQPLAVWPADWTGLVLKP